MNNNHIDINNSDSLRELKESINSKIDERIAKTELNERVRSIDKMPVYKLSFLFENISDRLSESSKGQKIIGKYVKTVKGNRPLKEAYTIYNGIINPKDVADTYTYITEAVNILKECHSDEYDKGVDEMRKVLKEAVRAAGINSEEFDKAVDSEKFKVFESVDCLAGIERKASNITEITKQMNAAVKAVDDALISESSSVISDDEILSDDPEVLRQHIKNLYENAHYEEWENDAIKDIASYGLAGKDKSELFEDYKKECLGTLTTLIEMCEDNVEAGRFVSLKESLENKSYDSMTAVDDIFKLSELRSTLSNDIEA